MAGEGGLGRVPANVDHVTANSITAFAATIDLQAQDSF